jgi:2-iminobutanoate/2-iminopropanoate deaminase
MLRNIITTEKAPEPIGPYSQAIEANGFIFTSGQIALNPETGALLEGNVSEQATLVFDNLKAVLEAAQSSMDSVVKTTIYLKNMSDFTAVNEVYASYFGKGLPARSTVEVSCLPKNVLVEVDCIAVRDSK